jgi:hypothetical protein
VNLHVEQALAGQRLEVHAIAVGIDVLVLGGFLWLKRRGKPGLRC